ncbi:MAG: SRPBCC family protein [Dehalococcoidia bacterium]
MTMHLAGYEPGPRRRNGLATIREDIHLHIPAAEARAAVADPTAYGAWLPDSIGNYQADTEGLRIDIELPGRTETLSVRRAPSDDHREVLFRLDRGGAVEELAWGLHSEGQRECHITIEIAYRPASGFVGGAMETLLHRPQRTQAIRDLLWNLKRALEGPRDEAEPPG